MGKLIIVYVAVLLLCLFCIVRSRGRPEEYLYKKWLILHRRLSHSPMRKNPMVEADFQTLFPFAQLQEKVADYYMQKVRLVFLFVAAGAAAAFLITLQSLMTEELSEDGAVQRLPYGEGSKQLTVKPVILNTENGAVREKIEVTPIEIEVEERKYTQEQLEDLLEQVLEELMIVLPGENASLSHVDKPLCLPAKLDGFPFDIEWEISNYRLLSENGTTGSDVAEEGEIVNLIANISYFDFKCSYELAVVIYPREKTGEEMLQEQILEAVRQKDEETQYDEVFVLPTVIGGKAYTWSMEKEDYSALLFALFVVAGVVLFFAKDRELHQEIEKRQRELMCDYPAILSRLTLYIGAGMTVRGACHKVVGDYKREGRKEKERRYAYEELSFACYEMDNGVSEGAAYERFGRRCKQGSYSKLASLLSQNSKKGNSSLLIQLRTESERAQDERRNLARKLGEEAGTKLLFPMVLLLVMVMLMILVPAMLSFQM